MSDLITPETEMDDANSEKRCANCGTVTGAAKSFNEPSKSYLRVSKNSPTSGLESEGAFKPDDEHPLISDVTTEYYCSEECTAEHLSK